MPAATGFKSNYAHVSRSDSSARIATLLKRPSKNVPLTGSEIDQDHDADGPPALQDARARPRRDRDALLAYSLIRTIMAQAASQS